MDPSLYEAAMKGDLNYLHILEELSNFPPQLTPCQETVLHVATEFHKTRFAKAVVQVWPSLLGLDNSSGDTALHIAAREGHIDMVEFFIGCVGFFDIETGEYKRVTRTLNLNKDTALHCAARRGHESCVKLLAEADAEVCSFVNKADESPLYLSVASATSFSRNKMAEIIINCASSSASHKGPNGLTALHPPVILGYYKAHELINSLVKWRRKMIREGDNLGMTLLHYAAYYGRIKAIKLFLEHDSSAIYVLNNDDESAIHVAAFNGQVRALEELVKCRPDCSNMVDNKGRTALHAAVLGDQQVVVKFILNTPRFAGLINKGDKDGNTPLHLAAHFNFHKTIQVFSRRRQKAYNLNILNNEFLTPFDVYDKLYHRQNIQEMEVKDYAAIEVAHCNLRPIIGGVMASHQSANTKLKKTKKEPTNATEETSRNKLNKAEGRRGDFGEESALEVNLLVAMLVATVTFTAGFTVPGGFVNNGEDEGLATLINKPVFQVFVVFNTLAFCCSIFAVLVHFATSLKYHGARVYYKGIAAFFTAIAILAMVFAFCSGTYVVLTKSTGLSLVPFIILASFVLLYPISHWLNEWIKKRTFGGDLDIPIYLRTQLFMDRRRMQRNRNER